MFVVRLETDEALVFRAFRKGQTAKSWAVSKERDSDFQTVVGVYEVADIDDEGLAVEAVRDGRGTICAPTEHVAVAAAWQGAIRLAASVSGFGSRAGIGA